MFHQYVLQHCSHRVGANQLRDCAEVLLGVVLKRKWIKIIGVFKEKSELINVMNVLTRYCRSFCLTVLCLTAAAQDAQKRAEALLAHARQLSDIRVANAPSFQLNATFSFVGQGFKKPQGSYIETWIPPSRWRRETVLDEMPKIEIRDSEKRWIAFPEELPVQTDYLPMMMDILDPATGDLRHGSVAERAGDKLAAECATTKPGGFQFGFCFETKTGVLLEKLMPERRPQNTVAFRCGYGRFQKFGEFLVPAR